MIGPAHHYGVTVSDVDEALGFYRDVLDLEVTRRLSFASEAFGRFVGVEGADVDIVFLDAGGIEVELLEYDHPPGGDANAGVSNNDVGASHVCFEVDRLEALYEDLPDDVESVSPPQTLEGGATVVYLKDPDGNVVELLEP